MTTQTNRVDVTLTFATGTAVGTILSAVVTQLGELAQSLVATNVHGYDIADELTWGQTRDLSSVFAEHVARADTLIRSLTAEDLKALPDKAYMGIKVLQDAMKLADKL